MVVVVVDSKFSVLLWSRALVLDLDQAEQLVHLTLLSQPKHIPARRSVFIIEKQERVLNSSGVEKIYTLTYSKVTYIAR